MLIGQHPQSARRIDVVVAHDGNRLAAPLARMLNGQFRVGGAKFNNTTELLETTAKSIVFCMVRFTPQQLPNLRRIAAHSSSPPVFVFPTYHRTNIEIAESFEQSKHFVAPFARDEVTTAVRNALQLGVDTTWRNLKPLQKRALKSSRESFDAVAATIASGERMPIAQVYDACKDIQANLTDTTFDTWLDALQHHHDSSFRHSMLVCGALAFFSHDIGIRGEDLRKITVGTFLHDAGKALIPLTVLDKPGKLDDKEYKVIQRHPVFSRDILIRQEELNPDVITMAASHHEKLDGTGYPEGLSGGQISDIVRLTAISDVYSALIEERSYKRGMPNDQAFEIMLGLDNHLEIFLVGKFREYVMDIFQTQAA